MMIKAIKKILKSKKSPLKDINEKPNDKTKIREKKLVKESGRFWGRFRCFLQYVPEERAERQTLQQRSI